MIIIKPDAFQRRLVGEILSRFEVYGIRKVQTVWMTVQDCEGHYREHIGKDFYPGLVAQMTSGLSLIVDLTGSWKDVREVAMEIREEYGTQGPRNLIHASDSEMSNKRETSFWFER